ncbi:MAG TPA: formylglycine-generating enzyme family protein [Baekduia sp.]|uniref:formylglycine-generating enzyme family protein n=1 Tax=Baekduia sp. TaxID=2600305 RepID=UPI002B5C12C0|nr:formylglycine-generating enzyme family protein [Baekduia sp.]HMJ37676.1 formylglycine-generating enzyme family protein [Baekduia sp.]
MAWIPGGTFAMGSTDFYPEERPVRDVSIDGFWMDVEPVTVSAFRRFVRDTGYQTVAERALDPALYPEVAASALVPGSLVFQGTPGPVDLRDVLAWWSYVPGARWDRPEGPGSHVYTRGRHPVTHIAYEDAAAYAGWAGKALPGEAEWERAARGGLDGARFAWGDELLPGGRHLANWWQGEFPWQNLELDGWARTSPVGSFPPNGFGLHDTCGNTWEWTVDAIAEPPPAERPACCGPPAPERIPRRVIKGGSHLCAPSYCLRFRPAARQFEAVDTSTSHLGFRCVVRSAPFIRNG